MPTTQKKHLLAQVVSGTIAVLGSMSAIYAIWGPIWPTFLTVEVGEPSSDPFKISFIVKNKSVFFGKNDVFINCKINSILFDNNSHVEQIDTFGMDKTNLNPESTNPFRCFIPFRPSTGSISKAEISIFGYYRKYPFGAPAHYDLGTFSFDADASPPRWVPGRFLGVD